MPGISDSIMGSFPYRFASEIDQPTQGQGMTGAQFGGSPQSLHSLLLSPGMQSQMNQFGMGGYSGEGIRQSPFFPNPFMQHHPQFGGALTGMMSNAAMTPEAPMVSGAGSGISRAMQGMMGGPEMLRQYQVRQMMAPLQLQGAMLPAMDIQRKQEMLHALEQAMQAKEGTNQQQLENERMKLANQGAANELKYPKPEIHSMPWGYTESQFQPGQQAIRGGSQLAPPQAGAGMPMPQMPNIPGVSPGWKTTTHPYDETQQGAMAKKAEGTEAPKTKGKVDVENIKQKGATGRTAMQQAGANARTGQTNQTRRDIAGGAQSGRNAKTNLDSINTAFRNEAAAANAEPDEAKRMAALDQLHTKYYGPGGMIEKARNQIPQQQYNQATPPAGGPPPASGENPLINPKAGPSTNKKASANAPTTGGSSGNMNQAQPQQGPPPQPTHTLKGRPIAHNGSQWIYTDDNSPVPQ